MAAGEYVSMRAQRELFENEIEIERRELAEDPKGEEKELELIYRSKGLPNAAAAQLASEMMSDPDVALDTHAKEELGLNMKELGFAGVRRRARLWRLLLVHSFRCCLTYFCRATRLSS